MRKNYKRTYGLIQIRGKNKMAKNKKQTMGDDQTYKDGAQRLQEDKNEMIFPKATKKSKKK
jgi:hypothetical protein